MKFILAPICSAAVLLSAGLSLLSAVEADRVATRAAILASWDAPVDLGPVPTVEVKAPSGAALVPLDLPARPRFAWDLAEDKPSGAIVCRVERLSLTGGNVRSCVPLERMADATPARERLTIVGAL